MAALPTDESPVPDEGSALTEVGTPTPVRPRKAGLILFNVCLAMFMVALDNRVLLVALPTLTQIFKTDLTTIQWTLLIYELALIGLVITLGRMGDLFGRKRFYVVG